MTGTRSVFPGFGLLVVLAGLAHVLGSVTPFHSLLVAIALGAIVANTVGLPAIFREGVDTYQFWLEVGIVLMGVRISLGAILDSGPVLLLAVVGVVAFSLVVVELLARGLFGLPDRLGSLLAAGASVCGVSAVVAVAGVIRADETDVAYATSTILVFDALTLFLYPVLGHVLAIPDRIFGIWAGLTMFSTGPVTAAGFAHSAVAGEWATVTKLARNVLLGGLVVGYSFLYTETGASSDGRVETLRTVWDDFPTFVLGFAAFVLLASSGALGDANIARIIRASDWAFLVAFAGLGTSIEIRELRGTGVRPLALVGLAFVVVSAVALGLVTTVF